MREENQIRQPAPQPPYGGVFESRPRRQSRDSRQFLQLPALVMLLCPETFVVRVQLLQLQLLLLGTTV